MTYFMITSAFCILCGICIFSFANVLVYRIPLHRDFVQGRSACTSCGHELGALDLVPVLNWVFLGGKCRYCKAEVSSRYAIVELWGGVCAAAAILVLGLTPQAALFFALSLLMSVIALIDHDTKTIPNGLVIAVAVLGLFATMLQLAVPNLVFPFEVTLADRAIGVFAASVPLLLVALASGGFGGGDIKLMASLGLLLGWKLVLLTLFLGVVIGGLYAIAMLATGKLDRKSTFAFGPFLSLAALVNTLFGNSIINVYLGLFGLA